MTIPEVTKAIISTLDTAVVAARGGRVVYLNPAAADLFGGNCVGSNLAQLVPDYIAANSNDSFAASTEIRGGQYTVKAMSADDIRLLLISGESCRSPLSESLETVLRRHLSNIRLTITNLTNLAENSGDSRLADYIAMLNRACYRITRNLDNLSVISYSQRGDLAFIPEELDIAGLFGDIINTVTVLTHGRDLKFIFDHESGMKLVADRNLVQQLLLNLLSNSINACKRGGVILVTLKRNGKSVVLSVSDNGCGIPEAELATVFERYKHRGSPESGVSCGMGLTAARIIAAKHNGAMVIESRGENRGACVRVTLSAELGGHDGRLHSPDPGFDDSGDLRLLLVGLSDCLDTVCYSGILED